MTRARLFALVLASSCGAGWGQDSQPQDSPAVRPVHGSLLLWRDARRRAEPIKGEARVLPSDRIGTAGGEYASLSTEGDTIIGLVGVKSGSDTGLSLERVGSKLAVRIIQGSLVVQSFETEVTVRTAHGQIEAKGAYFRVEVAGERTRVLSLDGAVTFSTSLGSVKVEAGQESSARKGEKPAEPARPRDGAVLATPDNLLKNAGFEEGSASWLRYTARSEEPMLAAIEDKLSHSGKKCARLRVTQKDLPDTDMLGMCQRVTLVPGRRYLLRVFARLELKQGEFVPVLSMALTDKEQGFELSDWPNGQWKMKHAIFVAEKADYCVKLSSCRKSATFDATLWVDDFFLAELPDAPRRQ